MSNLRLIARLDVKGPFLIKPVQLEGVRKVGDPREFARRYYEQGVDAVAMAHVLHYSQTTITAVRTEAPVRGLPVREVFLG
jgi:cyclase